MPTRILPAAATVVALLSLALAAPGLPPLGTAALSAQKGDRIDAGSRVRVGALAHGLERAAATVGSIRDGRVVLAMDGGGTVSLEPSEIQTLEVRSGTGDRAGVGLLIGAAAGGLVGGGLGFAGGDDGPCAPPRYTDGSSAQGLIGALFAGVANGVSRASYERCQSSRRTAGEKARGGALTGAIVGGLLGLSLGRKVVVEKWTRVDVSEVEMTVRPLVGSGGAGVAVTIPLGR